MSTRAKVDPSKVVAAIKAHSLKYRKKANLQVGFSAPYAVYVHENLQAQHKPPTRAKFLEEPARRFRGQMGKEVLFALRAKKSLESGLLAAGNLLLAESQKIVPVDTGVLKASGFVKVV